MGKTKSKQILFTLMAAVFLAAAFVMPGVAHADSSGNGSSLIDSVVNATSVTISAADAVSFNIVPTSSGMLGVGKGTVSVTTTASSGYKLYMSGPNVDTNGKTALYLEGVSTSNDKLLGIPSTSTPITFPATNQWGYAVPSLSGAGFSDVSNYETAYTATQDSGSANASLSSTTWKGLDNNYQLAANTTSGGSGSATIYYAAYVDSNTMPGSYKNTVVFTAFTEGGKRVAVANPELNDGDNMEIVVEYQSSDYKRHFLAYQPEAIANFIGARPGAERILMTTPLDQFVLDTIGNFINHCTDEALLEAITAFLIPIQKGKKEAAPIFCPTAEEVEAHLGI